VEYICPICRIQFDRYWWNGHARLKCSSCGYWFQLIDNMPVFQDSDMVTCGEDKYPVDLRYRYGIIRQYRVIRTTDVHRGVTRLELYQDVKRKEKTYRVSEYDGSIK